MLRVRRLLLLIALAAVFAVAQASKKPLTNSDVVDMVKAGLDETTIVLAIKTNGGTFDTSPLALIEVKKAGASQNVLNAMLNPAGTGAASSSGPANAPSGDSPVTPAQKPAATGPHATDGPFGFRYGMSKEEAVRLVGRAKIEKEEGSIVVFSTAPRPHPDFETYMGSFSPTQGLLKITAISKDVQTSGDGSELRSRFSSVREALVSTYGKPKNDFDFVKSGSLFDEPKYFMMSMLQKDRTLAAYWMPVGNVNHITTIAVRAEASNSTKGYVVVGYEFEGWDAFVDQQQKKKDSVF